MVVRKKLAAEAIVGVQNELVDAVEKMKLIEVDSIAAGDTEVVAVVDLKIIFQDIIKTLNVQGKLTF